MTVDARLEWICEERDFSRFYEFLGIIRSPDSDRRVVKPMPFVIHTVPDHQIVEEGTFRLSKESARSLMDALWRAGLRPTASEADMRGEVKRLEAHLADMRTLVFKGKT